MTTSEPNSNWEKHRIFGINIHTLKLDDGGKLQLKPSPDGSKVTLFTAKGNRIISWLPENCKTIAAQRLAAERIALKYQTAS